MVWAGGIKADELAGLRPARSGPRGRLTAQPDLTVEGHPHVYAIGDMANIPDHDGQDLPQLGSVALQAGRWAAQNILADIDGKPRKPFHYQDKGIMAMIGRGRGRRRDGAAPPRAARSRRLRRLARRARLAHERRAQQVDAFVAWAWDFLGSSRGTSIIDPQAARIDWGDETDDADSEATT